jgi:transketolase
VGIGGGQLYSTLGATHHAQEDIAVATSVPNLQVIAPCDPLEVQAATRWCAQKSEHPTYLRLGKAGENTFTSMCLAPWTFGKVRYLTDYGADLAILSYGHTMQRAWEVMRHAQELGYSSSLISVSTLKPLDVAGIKNALINHRHVVVIEEASGAALGTRVQAVAASCALAAPVKVFQLPDAFNHAYGSHDEILHKTDLDLAGMKAWVTTLRNSTKPATR